MLRLDIETMIEKIRSGHTFHAIEAGNAFELVIDDYAPFIGMAIHNGHQLRESLLSNCLLNDKERLKEEDPYTGDMVAFMPIRMIAHDSRYEYDLNRSPEEAIYKTAWGKAVWRKPLSEQEKNQSLEKHNSFYKVLQALTEKAVSLYGSCILFDIHSYNQDKYQRKVPMFNIGTSQIDMKQYGSFVKYWKKELTRIQLPNLDTAIAFDDVFQGKGYLAGFIREHFEKVLVLPTEIKKVYCDLNDHTLFPLVLESLQSGLKQACLKTASFFCRKETNLLLTRKNQLLSSEITPALKRIDSAVYQLVKNLDLLYYINPVNLEHEKKRFFLSRFKHTPEFKFRQLRINLFELKSALFKIDLDPIKDINIMHLYRDIIQNYSDHCDLLFSRGTRRFFYKSMDFFGEPSTQDIKDAKFLMHCPEISISETDENLSANDVRDYFLQKMPEMGVKCKIEISSNLVADAMVISEQNLLQLKKNARFSMVSMKALLHHEVGVHVLTGVNSRLQPLKILRSGLPLDTATQEGLAILAEFNSGNLTSSRLKTLAMRTLAVARLIKGESFQQIFTWLIEEYNIDQHKAFYLTARIFRGGGFTKDFVYLKGFKRILEMHRNDISLENLLIGKTSVEYHSLINEMVERKMLYKPKYKSTFLTTQSEQNPVFDFVLDGITAA